MLVGEDAEKLKTAVSDMAQGKWKPTTLPDRWDGRSAERVIQTLLDIAK